MAPILFFQNTAAIFSRWSVWETNPSARVLCRYTAPTSIPSWCWEDNGNKNRNRNVNKNRDDNNNNTTKNRNRDRNLNTNTDENTNGIRIKNVFYCRFHKRRRCEQVWSRYGCGFASVLFQKKKKITISFENSAQNSAPSQGLTAERSPPAGTGQPRFVPEAERVPGPGDSAPTGTASVCAGFYQRR